MLSNFPIDVFDRTDGQPSRWPTIGIKLSAERSPGTGGRKVTGLITLGKALVGTLTSWYDLMHINDGDVIKRTIFVDTTGVRSTDFGITKRQQEQLYENGRVRGDHVARQAEGRRRTSGRQASDRQVDRPVGDRARPDGQSAATATGSAGSVTRALANRITPSATGDFLNIFLSRR